MGDTKFMAEQGAKALVKKLGKRWKPRVWENMGWYYSAKFDGRVSLEVIPSGNDHTVYLNVNPQIVVHGGTDPVAAVKYALRQLDETVAKIQAHADELKGCL